MKRSRHPSSSEEDSDNGSNSTSWSQHSQPRRANWKKPSEVFRTDFITAMKLHDTYQLNPEDYYVLADPWRQEWEKGVQVPVSPHTIPQPVARPYKRFTPRGRCYSNLVVPARTTHVEFQVSGSLWNCRSAANKAEFISAYASLQSLDFLALTETWITTDNTATPTALSSSAHVFSHTPRASGQRGGGTGILISPKWTFSLSPLTYLSIASFEFHAVTVTSPFKLNILIIYRPPGSLGEFINELDALISSFPEDGSPLTVLDHFRRPSPLPHLAHQLILDRWLRPFRLQESESCTPSEKPTLDPSDVNNYRPVSLLSFLSKTLERAVLGQLSCYLSQNDLLDPNQSGFKTSHSTETALLCVTEALRTAKANSLSSALILLDLSAAFDTVNHQILLSTLSELGISGVAHAWIASYLTGRSYQVAWRESVSAPRALTTGVPQGSVLGPLLFSLYTKSLGSVISSHGLSYHCYADDTQLIFSFPPSDNQVVNRISACLADISVWMTDHHLKLNLGKTELLFLPGKDCPFHDLAITVDNSIVSSSQSAKNLGVILDNTLSFSTNIKAVTRSCRFMLYNIRRVRPCLTQEAAQVLIQALVISRLDYCNSLLAGLPACAIKPLQLIQNAAARLVFNFPKFSHVTPLLRSLHWLPVEARIRYKTMVLAYGAVRGTAPPYLQALIRPYTQTRALRSSTSGLLASLPLRKYSSRSAQSKLFAALAPQWWNKLPHDARGVAEQGMEVMFTTPKKWIRSGCSGALGYVDIQTLSEGTCRYDLNDTDVAWLELINHQFTLMGMVLLDEMTMERVMEEFERRCYDRMSHAMATEEGLGMEYDEDVVCDVCRSPDGEDNNEMVFCDKCNVCVHQVRLL
ncbi:uncharacterized protein [Salvelinus alpinus]